MSTINKRLSAAVELGSLTTALAEKNWKLENYSWYPEYDSVYLKTLTDGIQDASIKNITRKILQPIFSPNVTLKAIPRMILWEFEPDPLYRQVLDLFKVIADISEDIFKSTSGLGISEAFNKLADRFSIENIQKAVGVELNSKGSLIDFPMKLYSRIISGQWLKRFELPYYGSDCYHGHGQDGWTSTDFRERALGNFGEILSRFGLGSINFPWIPQFQVTGIGPVADEITCVLYLYNYTLDNFIKNFKFLFSLTSGSFWLQSGVVQRGSNLYQVRIPGRMIYYLCTADMLVESIGKSRTMKSTSIAKLISAGLPKIFKPDPYEPGISSASANTNALIPDGYRITLKFQSIIPNTFNALLFSLTEHDNYSEAALAPDKAVKHWGLEALENLKKL
jgi:hypothetical protein